MERQQSGPPRTTPDHPGLPACPSVRLSVCPSVRLSVCRHPFTVCGATSPAEGGIYEATATVPRRIGQGCPVRLPSPSRPRTPIGPISPPVRHRLIDRCSLSPHRHPFSRNMGGRNSGEPSQIGRDPAAIETYSIEPSIEGRIESGPSPGPCSHRHSLADVGSLGRFIGLIRPVTTVRPG